MKIINIAETGLEQAVLFAKNILDHKGIIIHPTDTIYGIAGNILEESVYHIIVDIKQRDLSKAISWQVKNVTQLLDLVNDNSLPDKFRLEEFCDKIFPGAITVVLPVDPLQLPRHLKHLSRIGFRIPDHPFCQMLTSTLTYPLTTTSANISDKKYIHDTKFILSTFKSQIDYIFTETENDISEPSTVISIDRNGITLLREGKIQMNYINEVFEHHF